MLVNVYSYRVMVKIVFWYGVHGNRVFSNPVQSVHVHILNVMICTLYIGAYNRKA